MDIDVEHGIVGQTDVQGVQAGLFGCLPQGHPQDVGITVRVSTGLKPLIVLAMVQQQHAVTMRIRHPGRAGHVARPEIGAEAILVCHHEFPCPRHVGGFFHESGFMCIEQG